MCKGRERTKCWRHTLTHGGDFRGTTTRDEVARRGWTEFGAVAKREHCPPESHPSRISFQHGYCHDGMRNCRDKAQPRQQTRRNIITGRKEREFERTPNNLRRRLS